MEWKDWAMLLGSIVVSAIGAIFAGLAKLDAARAASKAAAAAANAAKANVSTAQANVLHEENKAAIMSVKKDIATVKVQTDGMQKAMLASAKQAGEQEGFAAGEIKGHEDAEQQK